MKTAFVKKLSSDAAVAFIASGRVANRPSMRPRVVAGGYPPFFLTGAGRPTNKRRHIVGNASALAGLLDPAAKVFSLARQLAWEFEKEFREHSALCREGQESAQQRYREKICEYIAAVFNLSDAIENSPPDFEAVADQLRQAGRLAKRLQQAQMSDAYRQNIFEMFPELNQVSYDGYESVKAARKAHWVDDPWAFLDEKPKPPPTAGPPSAPAKAMLLEDNSIGAANGKSEPSAPLPPAPNPLPQINASEPFIEAIAAGRMYLTSQMPKPKRSTERGEGRTKLIAALTKHHQYAESSCLKHDAIGNNELARLADVSESTASAFFNREFNAGKPGGFSKYRAACSDSARIIAALKLLNQEYSPHHLFGASPPGDAERDDED